MRAYPVSKETFHDALQELNRAAYDALKMAQTHPDYMTGLRERMITIATETDRLVDENAPTIAR